MMLILFVYFFGPGGIIAFCLLLRLTDIFGVVFEASAVRPGGSVKYIQNVVKIIFLKYKIILYYNNIIVRLTIVIFYQTIPSPNQNICKQNKFTNKYICTYIYKNNGQTRYWGRLRR